MPSNKPKSLPSTQKYLNIAEIRDDSVVLKDGSLRAIILVSSINFALKSEDEQEAIVSGYITFLNSLNAPLQVLIQSRQLNLDEYLVELKKAEREQTNDLLRLQTAEYIQYISELVKLGNIMTKRFYVVVPYDPFSNKKRSFFARVGDVMSPTKVMSLNQRQFEQRHKELFVIVDKIFSGLSSMGLNASILDTQSLIELFYDTYNPVISENQKMVEINKLRLEENNNNV